MQGQQSYSNLTARFPAPAFLSVRNPADQLTAFSETAERNPRSRAHPSASSPACTGELLSGCRIQKGLVPHLLLIGCEAYICHVKDVLNNPVYQALCSGDRQRSRGTETAKFFDEAISPFAGLAEGDANGFDELFELLPEGRGILYATPLHIATPAGWQLIQKVEGLQMVLTSEPPFDTALQAVSPLTTAHVDQMMKLAKLTKPGPFGPRTIEFGHYFGIFHNETIVAMAGQRLHLPGFTEISAVCTHPDHLGKGYAAALVLHQLHLIVRQAQTPFLHVRGDNERAVSLYKRLGFTVTRNMNFYFMKRMNSKS